MSLGSEIKYCLVAFFGSEFNSPRVMFSVEMRDGRRFVPLTPDQVVGV